MTALQRRFDPNFTRVKQQTDGSALMTKEQKQWVMQRWNILSQLK